MINRTIQAINGATSVIYLAANSAFCFCPVMFLAFIKLAVPVENFRNILGRILIVIAESWISVNNFNLKLTKRTVWEVTGLENVKRNEWYLVISNHRSWTDIVVLQKIFNRKIPFLKFFLKKELIWVPLLGLCWWALDFPFVKRYSKELIDRKPHLRGKDIEISRKACETFKKTPVSVMNFVEGTRFTTLRHRKQNSPFRHLLRPKAGGIGFVLDAMGQQLSSILNVTIAYPDGESGFWQFLCGRVRKVKVHIDTLPLTGEILGNYSEDSEFRERFHEWLNGLWLEKDRLLKEMGER